MHIMQRWRENRWGRPSMVLLTLIGIYLLLVALVPEYMIFRFHWNR